MYQLSLGIGTHYDKLALQVQSCGQVDSSEPYTATGFLQANRRVHGHVLKLDRVPPGPLKKQLGVEIRKSLKVLLLLLAQALLLPQAAAES
jgi:hypothetical protein